MEFSGTCASKPLQTHEDFTIKHQDLSFSDDDFNQPFCGCSVVVLWWFLDDLYELQYLKGCNQNMELICKTDDHWLERFNWSKRWFKQEKCWYNQQERGYHEVTMISTGYNHYDYSFNHEQILFFEDSLSGNQTWQWKILWVGTSSIHVRGHREYR